MEIIKIMNAVLAPCQTDGEYQWAESSECAYGRSWEGDVRGYLENALLEGHDPEEVAAMMSGDYEGSIHDLPEGASVLVGAHGDGFLSSGETTIVSHDTANQTGAQQHIGSFQKSNLSACLSGSDSGAAAGPAATNNNNFNHCKTHPFNLKILLSDIIH